MKKYMLREEAMVMSFGIDIGETSLKAVLLKDGQIKKTFLKEHHDEVEKVWQEAKEVLGINENDKVVSTGYFRDVLPFPSVPEKVAQEKAVRFLYPDQEITLSQLGGSGFSVLKTKVGGQSEYRRNPLCAAGTGSFAEQILNRIGTSIDQVDKQINGVKSVEITSRCAVTMKTDFTHLLNQGYKKEEVSAGLLECLAKNAVILTSKSALSPRILVTGGLSESQRVVQTIKESFNGILVQVPNQSRYFEAIGAALIAEEEKLPSAKAVRSQLPLVFLPGLRNYLNQVTKIVAGESAKSSLKNLILGLDIGSTGSKIVVFNGAPIFEAYCETKGQPVGAAQNLIRQIPARYLKLIKAVGCTGSGREIVSSLLKASLPQKNLSQVFVLNEIAAHAAGAFWHDAKVDTIVDIGGQDSKFTLLEEGRMIDFAMNTVCSAGTGSFIAEQLQLLGIDNVRQFGKIALESPRAAELGQHCAVFIAKQIKEVKRKGARLSEIVAGLYYSIVLNYNNRVKGLRNYGSKIFLQGKPAENLALACALAKVTGRQIIVPPSPGSMGALGIAILTQKELNGNLAEKTSLNFGQFLESQVVEIKEFICYSTTGCGKGNECRVKVLIVKTGEQKKKFVYGGACDKYEKTGKSSVLALAPRPFLEREKLILNLIKPSAANARTIGIPRGLETEEILPLVITFFQELGFKTKFLESSGLKLVEEGSKLCQATFCSPLQLFAGEAKELEKENFLFLPKIIEIEAQKGEKRCYTCPLSQAAPDLFSPKLSGKILQPFLDFKKGYHKDAKEFLKLGTQLGCALWKTWSVFKKAITVQKEFEQKLKEIGKEALEFGKKNKLPVVVILGHPYIINSPLLSAGVMETVQEKGAIALPAECYPLKGIAPKLDNIYWGYGHRLLDVAYEVRRQPNVFPLWLSVYSCGPDSFLIHFFQYLCRGKPYTILESDAYTGSAGFKTRIEAFLYSVKNYQPKSESNLPDLAKFEIKGDVVSQAEGRKVLLPWMGKGSVVSPAILKSCLNMASEHLPMADEEALELGRQCTSGKECLPMIVTLGSLRKYLKNHPGGKFSYFMPAAGGPCRFGQYQLLEKIILEKLGLSDRVSVISANSETGYRLSEQFSGSMVAKSWAVFVLVDLLKDALHQTRPFELVAGFSERIFEDCLKTAEWLILNSPNDWSGYKNLWGMVELAGLAVEKFQQIPKTKEKKPLVLVTGEIYVRLDEFSNCHTIRELEALGAVVKLSPFREWVNYTTFQRRKRLTLVKQKMLRVYITWLIQKRIEARLYQIFANGFDWPHDHSVERILKAAKPYLTKLRPFGESALTIGLPLLLWQKKEIDGAVLVGPFECMPCRIGETQLGLISEKTGLPVLSLSFHGDPLDKELLESFLWGLTHRN